MADPDHENHEDGVSNLIHDPVVSHPKTEESFPPPEGNGSPWTWIACKGEDPGVHAPENVRLKSGKVAASFRSKFNSV